MNDSTHQDLGRIERDADGMFNCPRCPMRFGTMDAFRQHITEEHRAK